LRRLENRIVLVTGSARGIGKAISQLFHKEGTTVLISDIGDKEALTFSKSLSDKNEYLHLDVKYENEWRKITEFIIGKYGKLDILINNAGITGFLETKGPFDAENIELASRNEVHSINSNGVMLGCKCAIKLMKKRGGSIVNISSRSGFVGIPAAVAYGSSKASVRNHTKSVALYCAEKKYKIRCNSIHPAAIMTPMWDEMLGKGDQREKMIKSVENGIPMGYFGDAMDVAYSALYLANDESKYVTGIELTIDGGVLADSAARPE
jgi:3(or 17)beta-hydroxysteroid dehydrogenase